MRFFSQLEDELQSHLHELQWLQERGVELALRDQELGGECHLLVELMKEYQSLKTSLCSVTDSSETLMDIRSHEALKVEMLSRQQEVEQLSVRGKQLVMELKKIPERIGEEVESWSGGAVMELNESLNNLNHSRGVEERLNTLRVELLEKEQRVETLQSKVSELRRCSQSEETPAKL
ncbi:hypothetical protein F7725_008773, partial [Dissostichus mawsoni]